MATSELFANTGIQILCVPLKPNLRFTAQQVGNGWQRCTCRTGDESQEYPYIQWQMVPNQNQLLLAVDTTLGPESLDAKEYGAVEPVGYFCRQGVFSGAFPVTLRGLLGADRQPLPGIATVDFSIKSATAEGGEPKHVDLVIDFGNSRTGGLLIELRGDVAQEPLMNPLQLIHRYHLDAWDENGELARNYASWWFSSRAHWCTSPYLDPPRLEQEVWQKKGEKKGWWPGGGEKKTTIFLTPDTFQDFSQVRLGQEAQDLSLVMRTDGEVRTSVSSPKRYLWARDASWLEGSIWWMADPNGRFDVERHASPLRGVLLRYLAEDDAADQPEPVYDETPLSPRHAPRVLMTAALYEILCQAYMYVNSLTYRRIAGERSRMRLLRSVTLTYPSGMIPAERAQLQKQAVKAWHLFTQTVGRAQTTRSNPDWDQTAASPAAERERHPNINLSVDEASAVHLTYIWSEVQKLGRQPSLWFELMGATEAPETAEEAPAGAVAPAPAATASTRRRGGPPAHLGCPRGFKPPTEPKPAAKKLPEVRIACIDIGGGTTDLMIAKYTCESHAGGDRITGETLHRDGISIAGDHLVKRLLESLIVPQFAGAVGLDPNDVQRLFGPEVPGSNREFRAQRINWVNRLFVPLAQKYLQCAVDNFEDEEISHHSKAKVPLVAPEVVESLQKTIDEHWGHGERQVDQPLSLYYNREDFDPIVHEVFGDLLFDFCESIVEHKADVVLLAGLPSKLKYILNLVQTYLPLPNSRIISMYNRYVGTWYPYQNPDHLNPGVIVDPKSTVVVGAAIEFLTRNGMLKQFRFKMKDEAAKRSYYWGVMTDSRILEERLLFLSANESDGASAREETVLNVSDQRLVIGRKRRRYAHAQATPVYVIKTHVGQRLGEIDVNVTLVRNSEPDREEELEVKAVQGTVAGEAAELGKNVTFEWRTLADEQYYLDTGGLDKIELGN